MELEWFSLCSLDAFLDCLVSHYLICRKIRLNFPPPPPILPFLCVVTNQWRPETVERSGNRAITEYLLNLQYPLDLTEGHLTWEHFAYDLSIMWVRLCHNYYSQWFPVSCNAWLHVFLHASLGMKNILVWLETLPATKQH